MAPTDKPLIVVREQSTEITGESIYQTNDGQWWKKVDDSYPEATGEGRRTLVHGRFVI